MFRSALRSTNLTRISAPVLANHRSLVSSVLLTRTWENESFAEIKKEARQRGLSVKGNKATLITRIQQHDRRTVHDSLSTAPPPTQSRNASTVPASPSSPTTSDLPKQYLDIKIPDLSTPEPELPIQIPFVPDFWDSSRVKAEGDVKGRRATWAGL
ncbi:hypothetical protein EW146_g8925 [Bondarzewia mesenterica]|uniref:SAP domain-containing protein n=1 Tax=Bondarzewia mesenterica TaxID=1095465 RepID=A0A4S4LAU6_9AGAM|nr:hypothetical protein EW146_g8925 [Bondarzewia mesenterica]